MTRLGGVLRQSGTAFEGEKGKTYARVVVKMIESVIKGIEELEEGVSENSCKAEFPAAYCLIHSDQDSLKFLRMRTKKHELIISPGKSPWPFHIPLASRVTDRPPNRSASWQTRNISS